VADGYGYLFGTWGKYNICFCQQFISLVPALSELSRILKIRKEKQSVAEFPAELLNLAMHSGLGPTHSIQLFLKGLKS
jgi:hypothetical protein